MCIRDSPSSMRAWIFLCGLPDFFCKKITRGNRVPGINRIRWVGRLLETTRVADARKSASAAARSAWLLLIQPSRTVAFSSCFIIALPSDRRVVLAYLPILAYCEIIFNHRYKFQYFMIVCARVAAITLLLTKYPKRLFLLLSRFSIFNFYLYCSAYQFGNWQTSFEFR